MWIATHNFDTAVKTMAKILNIKLKEYPNLWEIEGLDLANRDLITLVRSYLRQDIEELIKRMNHPFLPNVILALSPQVELVKKGRMENLPVSEIIHNKINPNDKIVLSGTRFKYRIQAQLVVLARSDYVIREISLLLLDALKSIKEYPYCVKLHNTNNTNNYTLDGFARLRLEDIYESQFVQEDSTGHRVLASGIDFYVVDEFFLMKEDDSFNPNEIVKKIELDLKTAEPNKEKKLKC